MGHVNVKQLGMDMRDWYRLAFKSSLHGYVGMLSQRLAQTIQNSDVKSPEPEIRQLSPATTMAASATPIRNFPANTPEIRQLSPAASVTPIANTPADTPEPLPKYTIGKYYLQGKRMIQIMGPPENMLNRSGVMSEYVKVLVDGKKRRVQTSTLGNEINNPGSVNPGEFFNVMLGGRKTTV